MVDPILVTPGGGDPSGPFSGIATQLLRPKRYNCLAGVMPAIPAITPTSYQAQRTLTQTYVAQTVQPGAVLHFGDSLTECYDVLAVSPFSVNFGIGTDTAEGVLFRLQQYLPALNVARAVALNIGINDLSAGGYVAETKDMITRIVTWLSGPLVWTKIFNLGPPHADYNANINDVNAHVTAQLASRPMTQIVDINPVIAPAGALLARYHVGDGLHLNPAAYAVWSAAQQAALAKL